MTAFGTDYDGVIINIEPQKAKAFAELLSKEWEVPNSEAFKFWINKGGTSRRFKFDYFYEKQFNEKLSDNDYKYLELKFSSLLKNNFYPNLKLLPSAIELLKFAKTQFDHTFVSSGIPTEEIQYLTAFNKVTKYFDLILGTGKKFPSKREHFSKIKSMWGNPDVIFVADSPDDMKLAKSASFVPIGVTTNHSKARLLESGAEYVCDLKDVKSILEKFKLNFLL